MERIIDAHLHCHFQKNEKQKQIEELKRKMSRHGIEQAVLYLIDENDFDDKNYLLDWGSEIIPGVMLNPKDCDVNEKLDELQRNQIRFIKLLPYEQRLYYEDSDIVCEYAKKVQEHDMVLTICGSYGSKDIYCTNGVELAARILREGFQNPLIIAHGGMVRQLDAFSLMREYPNLYIDISFTIPFWWGSHVEQDLFFIMESLKYERIFWGSDYPYYSFEEELSKFTMFCQKYQISEENRQKILAGNFARFCQENLEE